MKRFALIFGAAAAAFAQQNLVIQHEMTTQDVAGPMAIKVLAEGMMSVQAVAGMPFSADETTTTTQTLMDGNRIVNASTTKVYRDAQGRTRTEHTLGNIGPMAAEQKRVSISINDPVTNVRYMVDPDSRSATKMSTNVHSLEQESLAKMKMLQESMTGTKQLAEEGAMKGKVRAELATTLPAALPGTAASGATIAYSTMQRVEGPRKAEELGTQVMEGVQVKGTRTTMTIPAGAIGNDREISIVNERWYSPDLKMNIMTKNTDPRMGETVFQVTNLNRANPDASLFQVPADYQMKESKNQLFFNTSGASVRREE